MTPDREIAIIGAGPYGLSIAAHLRSRDANFRIFGTPMQTWQTQMLRHSHLKSEGFASCLYEPSGSFTLEAYCAAAGLPYADIGVPVPRTVFTEYGLAFQKRYVPNLEQQNVAELQRSRSGFTLRLTDGEVVTSRRVVMAVGISQFQSTPPELAALPPEFVTHSAAHSVVDRFAGQDVVVVGAGASALDMAAELLRIGARVRVVARASAIRFHEPPGPRSLRDRIAAPMSGLGPGWRSRLCTDAPLLFHAMPERFRVEVVRRHLGPAPCWFTRDAVEGKVEFLLDRQLRHAAIDEGRIRLGLTLGNGTTQDIIADHVIAATGYRVDLARLPFLSDDLRNQIRLCDTSPAVTTHFESSVPGLYFVGMAAANSFGPLSRFAFGARFTAARLSAHLMTKAVSASPVAQHAAAA